MNRFRAFLGRSGLLGIRIALNVPPSTPVVGPASKSSSAQRAIQLQISGASRHTFRTNLFRQHFTSSLRPVAEEVHWGFNARSALGLGAAIGGIGYLCSGDAPGGASVALATALLLNGSILVHEAGHLAAARALGVAVWEFSVGIGPRVAWWQDRTTTYCIRAVPLLGFVRFYTAAQLAAAGGGGVYGSQRSGVSPPRLLESLSPGRRALVMSAGVAANLVLAAAFVSWQVLSYGELGMVVRPGVRVNTAEGWMGDGERTEDVRRQEEFVRQKQHRQQGQEAQQQQQQQESSARDGPQLQSGDVVLSVGQWRLPAGGAVNEAFVSALSAAAAEPPPPPAAAAAAGPDCDATAPECKHMALYGAVRSLDGVKMAVLRTTNTTNGGSGGGGDLVPRVLYLDAADVLRYDTLVVAPNLRVGYRRPGDGWEALQMVRRQMAGWTTDVVDCWRDILTAATTPSRPASAASAGATRSFGSSRNSCSSGSSSSSPQFVGPLGLVASAADYLATADQSTTGLATAGSNSGSSSSSSSAIGGSSSGSTNGSSHHSNNFDDNGMYDETLMRAPHPLLGMGVQLNLQLALFNLLPVPALDGGQLLLLALEALRGGRRLSSTLERAALLGSTVLMGGWLTALSVRDMVRLADRAAGRLEATFGSQYDSCGTGCGTDRGGDDETDLRSSEVAAAVASGSLPM